MADLTTYSAGLAEVLQARGETVAVAESSTAGLISASLLAVPGASAYFAGGSVIYTLASRRELLGIWLRLLAGRVPNRNRTRQSSGPKSKQHGSPKRGTISDD